MEALCLDTGAQSGVLWALADEGAEGFSAAGGSRPGRGGRRARGRSTWRTCRRASRACCAERRQRPGSRRTRAGTAVNALLVPLRHAGRVLGVVRLSDRVENAPFGDSERLVAQKIAELAAGAFAQRAARAHPRAPLLPRSGHPGLHRGLLRGRGPQRNPEGEPLRAELRPADPRDRPAGAAAASAWARPSSARWLEGVVFQVNRALRSTDLLAAESEHRFRILLPETDSLGAAVLKRRIREADPGQSDLLELAAAARSGRGSWSPPPATPPTAPRWTPWRGPWTIVSSRTARPWCAPWRSTNESFAGAVDALLERAGSRPPPDPRAGDALRGGRGGPAAARPGPALRGAGQRPSRRSLREGMEGLRGLAPRTEIVLVGDGKPESLAGLPGHLRVGAPRGDARALRGLLRGGAGLRAGARPQRARRLAPLVPHERSLAGRASGLPAPAGSRDLAERVHHSRPHRS